MNEKKPPALDQVLLHLVRTRLFLPLVIVSLVAIGSVGYLGVQALENQQQQFAQSRAQMVDNYLDQADRMLDAVGRVLKSLRPTKLPNLCRVPGKHTGILIHFTTWIKTTRSAG